MWSCLEKVSLQLWSRDEIILDCLDDPKSDVIRRRTEKTGTDEEVLWWWRQKLAGCGHKPGNTWSPQKLEEVWRDSPLQPPGRVALLTTLILQLWTPDLGKSIFLLFYAIQVVVICSGCHRKLRIQLYISIPILPGDSGGKESACNVGDPSLDLWVRKIPWRREWLPTPVFLPG